MTNELPKIDADLDLILERVIDVSPTLVWKAWTEPKHLMPWFCPKPWSVSDCRIDLKPGGEFFTEMRSPEGQAFPNFGCFLEIIPERRLVWTNALEEGFRPRQNSATESTVDFAFTAFLILTPEGNGTRYTAIVKHADPKSRATHDEMGFKDGWGAALDQLIGYVKTL